MARNLAVNFKLLTLRRVIVVVNLARAECSPFAAFKNNKINNHYSLPTATSTYLLKCEYFFCGLCNGVYFGCLTCNSYAVVFE